MRDSVRRIPVEGPVAAPVLFESLDCPDGFAEQLRRGLTETVKIVQQLIEHAADFVRRPDGNSIETLQFQVRRGGVRLKRTKFDAVSPAVIGRAGSPAGSHDVPEIRRTDGVNNEMDTVYGTAVIDGVLSPIVKGPGVALRHVYVDVTNRRERDVGVCNDRNVNANPVSPAIVAVAVRRNFGAAGKAH